LQAFLIPGYPYSNSFFTETNLRAQAEAQARLLRDSGYEYFMIDFGWLSGSEGDSNGRIKPNTDGFPDFPKFIADLHGMGLKGGVTVYVVSGVFDKDYRSNKQIAGSRYFIRDVAENAATNNKARIKIDFDSGGITEAAGKAWVKSVVNRFAHCYVPMIDFPDTALKYLIIRGVELIKMDFLKPHTAGDDGNGDVGNHFG
jgi:hypothetical protein